MLKDYVERARLQRGGPAGADDDGALEPGDVHTATDALLGILWLMIVFGFLPRWRWPSSEVEDPVAAAGAAGNTAVPGPNNVIEFECPRDPSRSARSSVRRRRRAQGAAVDGYFALEMMPSPHWRRRRGGL